MRKTAKNDHRIIRRSGYDAERLGRIKSRTIRVKRNIGFANDLVLWFMLESPFNRGRLFGRRDKGDSAHKLIGCYCDGRSLTITWASKQSPYRKFGGKRFLMERSSSHADLIRLIRRNCC